MRIFLMETDRALARSLDLLLRDCGYEVACCADAGRARAEIARWNPDLVVLDWRMQRSLGPDWVSALELGARRGVGVIVLSDRSDLSGEEPLGELDRLAFLAKPPDWERLRRLLDALQ